MQPLIRVTLAAVLTPLAVVLAQPTFPYVIRTVAGRSPFGGDGGPATAALLNRPQAVAVDSKGNFYIASRWDPCIRKVSPSGTISAFAEVAATDLAIDRFDNLYASDGDACIYKITPSGAVSVFAGSGTSGFSGDGGPATSARLGSPSGMALHPNGDLYFADLDNHRVRRIDATGRISTVAGSGAAGFNGDGPAMSVQLNSPRALAFDANNNLYIADEDNLRIRRMDLSSGQIATWAGNGGIDWGAAGDGGAATAASLGYPMGLAFDSAGNLYVSCNVLSRVRVIDRNGTIRAYAGNGIYGYGGDGGQAPGARLAEPIGLALDRDGSLLIADNENHRIRRVSSGTISTVAGASHYGGDNGPATSALLDWPDGVAVDRDGAVYIADMGNNRIRKVAPGGAITTYAGTGENGVAGDGGLALLAQLSLPQLLALDGAGNLFSINQDRVRKISPSGKITTAAQNQEIGDPRPTLEGPPSLLISAIATDAQGNLYFAETWPTCRVRKATPEGVITKIAGADACGYSGDGSSATTARISAAWGMVVDKNGDLYIADTGNHRIRKVSGGRITTVAGNDRDEVPGPTPQPAASASIGSPMGIAIDESGDLYVSDNNSPSIAKVSGGMVYRIAGNGSWRFSGDGVPALSASVGWATQLAAGSGRDIFLVDEANSRIHQLILNSPSRLEIASGDNQTVNVGEALARPLAVKLTGRAGLVLESVPVTFAIAAGTATLSAAGATTDKSGLASAGLTAGSTAGTVTVTATVAGLPAVRFTITVKTAISPDTPRISSGGVTGAGLSVPPVQAVSPNAIVTIWGENFLPAGSALQTAVPVAGQVPTKVAGLCVRFNDLAAPIYLVASNQANVIVPKVTAGAEVSVQAIRNCGEANELKSNVEKVAAKVATPEFLFFVARTDGKSPIAGFNVSRGYAYLGASGLIAGATFVPARPGDWLELYGVGWGATDPAVEPGSVPGKIAPTAQKVKVTIGGIEVAEQDIYYAGASPATPGLYQLNVRLPAGTPDGDQPVMLEVAGESTPSGAYITVKRE